MDSINLNSFCSTDPERPYLHKPWSVGKFSYATNGHIAIKVPRRDDVPENDKAPDLQGTLDKIDWSQPFAPAPAFDVPLGWMTECTRCDGRGTEHDCPDCACGCVKCRGTGQVSDDENQTIGMDGVALALRYARIIFALPGLMLPVEVKPTDPVPFKCDGGEGAWMPMRGAPDIEIR